jgi:hypothetical protein
MRVIVAALAAIGLLLGACNCGVGQAAGDPAVVAARTRQECVKTLVVKYKRTEVIAKGGLSEGGRPPFNPAVPVPSEETTLESTDRIVMDGEKLRYEDNHPAWDLRDAKFYQKSCVHVVNTSTGKAYYPNGIGSDGAPTGVLTGEARLIDIKSPVLTPITVMFRGWSPAISPYPVDDMKSSGIKLPIDGAPCQEYVIDYRADELRVSCWFDSTKEWALRRIRKQKLGSLLEQTDITSYRQDACGMIPTSWAYNRYSLGRTLLKSTKVQVLELRINDPQPAEQFELQFPPGTEVRDVKQVKFYRVKSDGSMRELSRTGEELPGSVPQPGTRWYQRHKWLIGGSAVFCVVAGLLYLMRRRLRPRAV